MKTVLTLSALCTIPFIGFAQVSISHTNTPPDSSAMLDIQSKTGGLLIPRTSFWYLQQDEWVDLSRLNHAFTDKGLFITPVEGKEQKGFVLGSPQPDNSSSDQN